VRDELLDLLRRAAAKASMPACEKSVSSSPTKYHDASGAHPPPSRIPRVSAWYTTSAAVPRALTWTWCDAPGFDAGSNAAARRAARPSGVVI
jgi:hypothetical protein